MPTGLKGFGGLLESVKGLEAVKAYPEEAPAPVLFVVADPIEVRTMVDDPPAVLVLMLVLLLVALLLVSGLSSSCMAREPPVWSAIACG